MYHSLVQHQIPGSENTVCVTPMQVQNLVANSNLCGSLVSSSMGTAFQIIPSTTNLNHKNLASILPPTNQFVGTRNLKYQKQVFKNKSSKQRSLKIEAGKSPKNNNNLSHLCNRNQCTKNLKFKTKESKLS